MSQVGGPDYLGIPVGLGAPAISLLGVQRGAVDYQTPLLDTNRVQSIRLLFVAHPGTTTYRLSWSFVDSTGTFHIASQFMDVWPNGWCNVELPVMGSSWFCGIQHVGGAVTDTYDFLVIPSFVSAPKVRAPVDGGILFAQAPTNWAIGETKTFNVQKTAWGLAYLQYGLNGSGWTFQGHLLDAGGTQDGFAWALNVPAAAATDVRPVMLTPSLLQITVQNNTGAVNSGYFTLAMAP